MNTNELKRPSEEDSADSKRLKAEIDTPTEKICYPRLVINGIPKFWGMNESKKFLAKLGVTYKQVRKVPNKDVCFVVFLTREDMEKALPIIEGSEARSGCFVTAKESFVKSIEEVQSRKRERNGDESTEPKTVREVTAAYADKPYEEQLIVKRNDVQKALQKAQKNISKSFKHAKVEPPLWLKRATSNAWKRAVCPIADTVPSPEYDSQYRNKMEFAIGKTAEGEICTGFSHGFGKIGAADQVPFIPKPALILARCVTEVAKRGDGKTLVLESNLAVYDKATHTGFWRTLTIRKNIGNQYLVMLTVRSEKCSEEDKQAAVEAFVEAIKKEAENMFIFIVGIALSEDNSLSGADNNEPITLYGKSHLLEKMNDLMFQLSPSSFFQVNTPAAEELYSRVREWAAPSPKAVVLDVCCGTGTIGMIMAKMCQLVIGVDIVEKAIEDAKCNSQANALDNTIWIAGSAETVLGKALDEHLPADVSDVVAIVDPPRGGLHNDVIRVLRNCRHINRLVYVSCNCNSLANDLEFLCRPPSNKYKGEAFVPIKAEPRDLFPHTPHIETVMLLQRGPDVKVQDTYGAVMKRKKEEEELAQGLKSANKDDDPKAGVKEEMKDTTEAAAQ